MAEFKRLIGEIDQSTEKPAQQERFDWNEIRKL